MLAKDERGREKHGQKVVKGKDIKMSISNNNTLNQNEEQDLF